MTRIETSIEIEAPIEKVFVFFSNPKNQEKIFVDSEVKIEDVSRCSPPKGFGSLMTAHSEKLKKVLSYVMGGGF
jgi:hypothetical protein